MNAPYWKIDVADRDSSDFPPAPPTHSAMNGLHLHAQGSAYKVGNLRSGAWLIQRTESSIDRRVDGLVGHALPAGPTDLFFSPPG